MATHAVSLRSADARDIAVVERLMADAFDARYGEAWTRNQCLGVLAMPGVRLTLADMDDGPAGFALVRRVLDEEELLLLAVARDHRRRGVGRALLRAVIAEARGNGVATLHLEVRAGNPAIRLYLGQGFAKTGERRGYYRGVAGELHDAHSYSLRLGEA
jgi:ribosomal-protein-alanine N-acetyltransferase